MNLSRYKTVIFLAVQLCISFCWSLNATNTSKTLPRDTTRAAIQKALQQFTHAAKTEQQNIHSIMVLQNGNVIAEQWMGDGAPDKPHILNSVSKAFAATAIGFAVSDGLLSLDDTVISFFPNDLPDSISDSLKAMTIRDLLMMAS